jgi:hypothetical protein
MIVSLGVSAQPTCERPDSVDELVEEHLSSLTGFSRSPKPTQNLRSDYQPAAFSLAYKRL